MMFIGLFWLVMILLLVRWVILPDSARALPEESRRMHGEIERLREEVDRLSGQVQRLLDEQSFLLRLLGDGEDPRRLGRGSGGGGGTGPRVDDAPPPADPPDRQSDH